MRTIMRGLARVTVLLIGMSFITLASLFVIGTYLTTWPILRLSPRDQRVKAAVEMATATMTLLSTFKGGD